MIGWHAPVGTLDPYKRVEAETIAWSSGVKIEPSSAGGQAVRDIHDGDYIEVRNVDFGAALKGDIPGRGYTVDLHGVQLNITGLIASQNHEQHYGIEHMAVETDDYQGTLAQLRKNGVRILEELPVNNGKHVCFVECPDGAQMEIIEKV